MKQSDKRTMGTLRLFSSPDDVTVAAAQAFRDEARKAIEDRGRFLVALAGGNTPRGLYCRLAEEARAGVEWSRVEFFWGDERPVPPHHPDSNYRMAAESMLLPLNIAKEHIHRITAEREDLDQVARNYQEEIAQVCGLRPDGRPPSFDLILLGMGEDGHTASLFPNTRALEEQDRWVLANPVPQLRSERVTLTVPIINQARAIHFLVTGEAKKAALASVLRGPSDPKRWPSQLVRPVSKNLVWFVDAAAAGNLEM